jgi:hypothetical protein
LNYLCGLIDFIMGLYGSWRLLFGY